MRAVQIAQFGGPEVLEIVDLPEPTPDDGQVVVEVSLAGVNYADTHQVENSYLAPSTLPLVPGGEVAGLLDGRRVVAFTPSGGYAERVATWPNLVYDVPDAVSDEHALALLLQGTTAWHILRTSARLAEGETVVVHAAAGGVGHLAVQLAKRFGAGRVIATASSEDKRTMALELGADVALDPGEGDLKAALEEANGGRKVDVVLEMTGGRVFDASLAALAPFGRLVTYGMASREAPEPIHPAALMGRTRAVIGFWLAHCMQRPAMITDALDELYALTERGELRPQIGEVYPLTQVRRAHEDLLARRTTGKLLLDVAR